MKKGVNFGVSQSQVAEWKAKSNPLQPKTGDMKINEGEKLRMKLYNQLGGSSNPKFPHLVKGQDFSKLLEEN